jgi:BirA family biotin operon repressor/biotin-[acetyl-CoA-carboxylase] ligase
MRPLTFQSLRLMADGEFHSGVAIARQLGVSRASVWLALNEAQAAGVAVHRVHGRGYRLAERLDWLDPDKICREAATFGVTVEVMDTCESTNTTLLAQAAAGAPCGRALVAEWQTAGRGRLGRAWHAGLASALTFSLLWRFRQGAAGLAGLSLAVGVGVARGLAAVGVHAGLKWPNDLLWRDAKLGGILIEMHGDMLGPSAAVIGVGLNVRVPEAERARIGQPVADLAEAAPAPVRRDDVLVAVLRETSAAAARFAQEGFAVFRQDWANLHAHGGRHVRMSLPDGSHVDGVAEGVDEMGALLVRGDGGMRRYMSGDVSLRAIHDPGR